MTDYPDDTPIDRFYLSARTENVLKKEGLVTVGDVRNKPDREFLRIPNFGRKSLKEVREVFGLHDNMRTSAIDYNTAVALSNRIDRIESILSQCYMALGRLVKPTP